VNDRERLSRLFEIAKEFEVPDRSLIQFVMMGFFGKYENTEPSEERIKASERFNDLMFEMLPDHMENPDFAAAGALALKKAHEAALQRKSVTERLKKVIKEEFGDEANVVLKNMG
jgi:hypothetical protein